MTRLRPFAFFATALAATLFSTGALAHTDDDCVSDLEITCDLNAGSDSHRYEACIDDLIWVCEGHVDPADGSGGVPLSTLAALARAHSAELDLALAEARLAALEQTVVELKSAPKRSNPYSWSNAYQTKR